jgi:hypothetical protein
LCLGIIHLFSRKRRIGPRADTENKEAGNTFQFFFNVKIILANFDPKISKIILGKKSKVLPISLLKNGKFSPGKKKTVVPLYCLQ